MKISGALSAMSLGPSSIASGSRGSEPARPTARRLFGSMGMRVLVASLVSTLILPACDNSPRDPEGAIDRITGSDCRQEESDGCLEIVYPNAKGAARRPLQSYFSLTEDGTPVDQYGLSPTIDMEPMGSFRRPLIPGTYELLVHRQRVEPTSLEDPSCRKVFRMRAAREVRFVVVYEPHSSCIIRT